MLSTQHTCTCIISYSRKFLRGPIFTVIVVNHISSKTKPVKYKHTYMYNVYMYMYMYMYMFILASMKTEPWKCCRVSTYKNQTLQNFPAICILYMYMVVLHRLYRPTLVRWPCLPPAWFDLALHLVVLDVPTDGAVGLLAQVVGYHRTHAGDL